MYQGGMAAETSPRLLGMGIDSILIVEGSGQDSMEKIGVSPIDQ